MEGASGRQRVNPPLGWCSSPDSSLPTSALLPFLPASFTTSSGLGSPSRAPSPELSYRRASLPPSTQHRSSGAARPASFLPDQPCPSPPVMNLFRFLGDLSHLLAIILLLLKIWKSRSCAGESPPPAERGRERAALGHREGWSSAGQSPPGLPAGDHSCSSRVTRGSAPFPRLRGTHS